MSETAIALIIVNVLWLAVHTYTLHQQAKERDELTMKIMAKNLTDYSNVALDRASAAQIKANINMSAEKQASLQDHNWVSLNDVEKDPYLLQKFSEAIPNHLNKL